MHDVHLLNFPIFEKHTCVIFKSMLQVFDKLCGDWKYKIIGITTYVEKNMSGGRYQWFL